MGWTKHGVIRIKKLTGKQEDQILVFAEKWNRIARSTEPWDEDAVEDGIRRFYKVTGCRQPKRGFWQNKSSAVLASKEAGYRWEDVAKKNLNFDRLDRSELSIRHFLVRSFEPPILKLVEDFMHRNIATSMAADRLREFGEARADRESRFLPYGQVDAAWLAIVDYFATVHGNEYCRQLEGLLQAVAACGFVWLLPDKVVYCCRPQIAKFDDQGHLHCEDGSAIEWPDGRGLYRLHGVPIDRKYILTPADELKLADILTEANSTVRMAVLRKFGFERLLATAEHRILSKANGNSLIQFKLDMGAGYQAEYLRVLRVKWQDKTGAKETIIPVPRTRWQFGADGPDDISDCEQVRRWTLGWPKEAMAVAET